MASNRSNFEDQAVRQLLDGVVDFGVFALDKNGRVLTWNSGAERITGYTGAEIIGLHIGSLFSRDERKRGRAEQELALVLSSGRRSFEFAIRCKDDATLAAAAIITLMRDLQGQPSGFAVILRDFSPGQEQPWRFSTDEEQFRHLVEGVEEYAIYMLDPNGNIVTWNSGAEKIKQYAAADIVGRNFACFYTAEDVAAGKPQHNLKEAVRLGHLREQGTRIRKDGTAFPAEVVITSIWDENRNLRGFSKVTRDVTDQLRTREAEAEKIAAQQANRAKDDFLAALSHELRTPLTPALAAASYLTDNASKIPAEFVQDVDTIRRNVQLQARLIDDLLDLTRVTRGKVELRFQHVDAHALLGEALTIVEASIGEKMLKVSTDLLAREHHIWADPIRIQQVFWNLISNAVKFTGAGGHIAIRSHNDDKEHFILEVTDTGIGIEPQRQASLFKAFEQGERAITRQFGGLGLGLAISKNLVDLHHGVITVESRGRSFGATFRVVLDAVKSRQGESDVAAEPTDPPAKPLRILLVEDHQDTRRILSRLLQHFGHQTSVAASRQSALALARTQDFDVILSDIGLPDGTGYDVVSEVKRTKSVRAIALTGFGTEADISRSKDAGFDFHLTKPVDVHELRSILGQLTA